MDFNHLLFSFDGRIPRKSYWIGILIIAAATIVLSIALAPLFGISFDDLSFNGKLSSGRTPQAIKLDILVKLIVLWPSLAILIKRLHDRNRSALMLVVELGFIKGTPDVNEYGLDPLKVIDANDTQEKSSR